MLASDLGGSTSRRRSAKATAFSCCAPIRPDVAAAGLGGVARLGTGKPSRRPIMAACEYRSSASV